MNFISPSFPFEPKHTRPFRNLMANKTSHRLSRDKFYALPSVSSDQLIADDGLKNLAFCLGNESSMIVTNFPDTIIDCSIDSTSTASSSSSAILFRHSFFYYFWRVSIGLLTVLFATLCCHTIYRFKLEHLRSYQQLNNITDEKTATICQLFQSKLNLYYKIPANYVSLGLLVLLIVLLIFFENLPSWRKRTFKSFWRHLSIPMIFNSHSHIYRFQSAAVFGIIALEILHIFDEYVIHGARHFQHGPLIDLIIQFGIGLMLGLRYFPILCIFERENSFENRLENIITYALATIYLYCEIVFKLQSDMNCAVDQRKMSIIKETLEKLSLMGVNVQQYLIGQLGELRIGSISNSNARFLLLDSNRTAKFNATYESSRHWYHNRFDTHADNATYADSNDIDNELTSLNYSLELNKQSIFYNILRNAPYYYYIVYLAVCLSVLFVKKLLDHEKKDFSFASLARWKYVRSNLLNTSAAAGDHRPEEYSRLFRCLNSLITFFKTHVYARRPYFRYSKLIVCIYTSAFTLIYYFTFWIQDHTYILTKKLLLFLNLILCGLADLSKDLCYNLDLQHINRDIQYICLLTAFITGLQLFFGLRHYQVQMCNAYRGVFNDIPTTKHISSVSIISKSIHYPGRFMGKCFSSR